MTDRLRGIVRRIVRDKGYGFLETERGEDFFFHRSGCLDFVALVEGARVTFISQPNPKGPRADDVRAE